MLGDVVVECGESYPECPDVPLVVLHRAFLRAAFVFPVSCVSTKGLCVYQLELDIGRELSLEEHGVKLVV